MTNYPQDTDQDDTLRLCTGTSIILSAAATLMLDGQVVAIQPGLQSLGRCSANGAWSLLPSGAQGFECSYNMVVEGWYHHTVGFAVTNAPCGFDTLFVMRSDSIYVIPLPNVQPIFTTNGPPYLCPGDTVALVGSCANCTASEWIGSGFVSVSGDTAWVIQSGNFTYGGVATDPSGCGQPGTTSIGVNWNPLPTLFVDPLDGIICPNDSAMIWTNAPGGDWQWYGPLGPLSVYNDTIFTSQQGFYYLEMTDTLGCQVTSQPILVTDYATPYLNVFPDNVICEPGETTTLQVVTTSLSSVLWEAPFAGSNAIEQVVSQPGIYTVTVNACAITTVLSVQVYGNTANAELTVPGPFTLCPGDEVTLIATSGQAIYYWEPGPIFSNSITTDTAGNYLLVVSDPFGCRDSLWTQVTALPDYDQLAFVDTDFCVGEPMFAVVSGEPEITWYGDAAQTQVIGMGNTLDMGVAQQSTTVWVEQIVGQCGSGLLEVDLIVSVPPDAPVMTGPYSACVGESLTLAPANPTATGYAWITPQGTFAGQPLVIDPVALASEGSYTIQAINPGCAPVSASFIVTVNIPSSLSIGNDTLICPEARRCSPCPATFSHRSGAVAQRTR
ncbi:MAG TPA: hypothetical protein PKY96_09885 [Flavobacteriales bacterium]|nr:hypothetical protein [Flavobacteriales bacterium]